MPPRPTPEDDEALTLLAKRDDLTEWEEGFLESLSTQAVWTERQGLAFDHLWERKMA